MNTPDFTLLSPEEAALTALQLTAKQLLAVLPHFTAEQLQMTLTHLSVPHDHHWNSKVRSFLQALTHRHQLEAMGQVITPPQVYELLELCSDGDPELRDKLQFVLVGLPQPIFEMLLQHLKESHLKVLKALATSESLQHHLTLLAHEMAHQAAQFATDLEELERCIEGYDVRTINQEDLDKFLGLIDYAIRFLQTSVDTTDKALALAWNSNRADLIERFTQIKENALRFLQYIIGVKGVGTNPGITLQSKLENKLNTIFGDLDTPIGGQALEDNDPAIEALAALALWVPQDYWEIGLLPGISRAEQLDLDPSLHTEQERALYRERLSLIAQENLRAIGLPTVGSLKQQHIYSKAILAQYIGRHRDLLTTANPIP